MEDSKYGLYIVAIVGIIAVVGLILLATGGNRQKIVYSSTAKDAAGAAVRSYDLGSCEYEGGYSSGCPCSNPSNGILSNGATLISDNCK